MVRLLCPRLICCDESGFTGNNLLNPDQRFFAYASHDLSLEEAECLIADARRLHPVQMPELKSSKLLQSGRGQDLIRYVLDAMKGRYIATIYDKRLSLAGKLFEYLYEPVLQSNNMLFYRHNLHRFVAMYFFILMTDESIEKLAQEFEAFMRSLDPLHAPTIFGTAGQRDPLSGQILRFVRGYNVIIAREARELERTTTGKWALDLTLSAVFSHLAAWGQRHPLIEIVCDDSKPLRAMSGQLDVMINRPDTVHLEAFGKRRSLTWNMSKPIAFASSDSHAGVQLADLIAGTTAAVPEAGQELRDIGERIHPHLHEDCILPDFDVVDLDGEEAPVNWLVLEELASRADRGDDPLTGMEAVFEIAKQSIPEFRRYQRRAGLTRS
jgi:hypothetical protein